MEPTREIFGNIQFGEVVYVLGTIVLAIFIYALYRRYKLWRLGRPEDRLKPISKRIWAFLVTGLVDILFHRKFFGPTESWGDRRFSLKGLQFKEAYPGLVHFLIFFGCIIFLIGSFLDFISHYFFDFMHGGFYLGYSVVTDSFGILVLVGVILAVHRRYFLKPKRLDNKGEDLIALLLIFFVVFTGFLVEGFRIAATELKTNPDWAPWSPGGFVLALGFRGLSQNALLAWHRFWWWVHMLLAFGAIAYVSLYWNRLWHIIVSTLNVFFRTLELPRGPIAREEFKAGESFGIAQIEDLTWKHLLDLDACTRCGRCQDACPAYATGKPLNPKKVILDLKGVFLERAASKAALPKPTRTLSDVVTEDVIWECTTCNACMEACPVFIEHVPKIIGMRRYLVEMKSKFLPELVAFFENIEQRSNPWGIAPADRAKWAADIDAKPFQAGQTEYLFYVGCTGSFDARYRQVSLAVAKILNAAGISWGILGREEKCCGDGLRRLGNEFVFDSLAKENIKMFQEKGIKKVITQCPHCYSTFKNDYRQYGAEFEVIHHTQLVHRLIQENKLRLDRNEKLGKVVFHDSCYLGRHNGIYRAPREVVASVTGKSPAEMGRRYERSFCCGGGGGGIWWEERIGKRISLERTEEALKEDPNTICVCCPYCLTMFEDGLKDMKASDKVQTLDIAEIVAGALKE